MTGLDALHSTAAHISYENHLVKVQGVILKFLVHMMVHSNFQPLAQSSLHRQSSCDHARIFQTYISSWYLPF